MKCFDVEITEHDEEHGTETRRMEEGVFAPNRAFLIQMYSASGAKARIIREYEKETEMEAASRAAAKKDEKALENKPPAVKPVPPPTTTTPVEQLPDPDPNAGKYIVGPVPPPTTTIPADKLPDPDPSIPPVQIPIIPKSGVNTPVRQRIEKPKFFTVAGIECKLENGKVYQKQWVKLLGPSSCNYRLISDKNNREIPLVGKHLEVLKWVSVEDEEQAELNKSILNIVAG